MSGGFVHLYCGDGKGKTTAAIGLSVRAAGSGKKVLFTQFFKNGTSSEIDALRSLKNIQTLHEPRYFGRVSNMSEREKAESRDAYSSLFANAVRRVAEEKFDVLVLDEIVSSCNHGIVDEKSLFRFLDSRPQILEVVLTGRDPSEELIARADYVTEMRKIKHPFDAGITARVGIEF